MRAARWPAGAGIALWRWRRTARTTQRERLRTGPGFDPARLPQRGGDRVQGLRQGVGPVYQRRYSVRIVGSDLDAPALMDRLRADVNTASPVEFAVFDKISGSSPRLELGDEYDVHMPGPWNLPVRVVERTPRSFRLATLQGHIEAGEIEFRAKDTEDGALRFTIESWTRSGDRLADLLYDRVRMAKEMQLHMWTHFCCRVAELAGGRPAGDVEVLTERTEIAGDSSRFDGRHLVGPVAGALARAFTALAKARGGRALHARGLVLDATLRLSGTSRFWGVPLLDDTAELRGLARLSRAVGLPSPFPDVLGLALRWRQPADAADGGEPATAELLLATTGHGRLGRHLLRPAARWGPGFYGCLLPYTAGDRHVLLGAVARRPLRGDTAALARAAGEGPIRMDLVVATELGPWERFGELVLTRPARTDDPVPVRFNPARHPITGLRPAGPLQQVRRRSYDAVQQVDLRTGTGLTRRRKGTTQRRGPREHRRLQRLFEGLPERPVNFEARDRPENAGPAGWHIDDRRQPLPLERPGPPEPEGSWEIARRLVRDYEFADPRIIRSAYRSGEPEPGADMLLEARFFGLRFHLGVRVGDVVDTVVEEDGRRARVWGWNYRTLDGHLERGQMDQEVLKWLDTGEVEFRLRAFSQVAGIRDPVVRLGFALFGRPTQLEYQRRACLRMADLTEAALAARRTARDAGAGVRDAGG
ncbi:hypothetical protein GCM10009527_038290 [Actinomadura nitritigenes]|uniref:DUF1990 family protein n=1 Tax=Actinomadura nitritigenes TaxID=134602 RepID=A0ABS3QSQ0_9ACTN|nr:DUF1990 family protein [Actinomadura nitritigenes]MBO2436434.1 DUF1990 family protein [Actinomadura nitritigenes]